MTTVKQLREFLALLPDDAVVRVLAETTRGHQTTTVWVDLNLPPLNQATMGSDEVSLWGNKGTTFLDFGTP